MVTAVELRKEWMLKGNKRAMTEPGNDINTEANMRDAGVRSHDAR